MREVCGRSEQDLKGGRPPRLVEHRFVERSTAAPKEDSQASLGEYAGSYFKKQREAANEKRLAEFRKKWHEILEMRRNERNA